MAIIRHTIPTTNYSKGRGGNKVNKIVIHWIVGSLASADATFKNPQRRASAHYGIENTKIIQWVGEKDTAWHASNFKVNQQSIGIEHSATPKRPATESTHKTSGKLVGQIAKRYNIKLDTVHIVPHKKYSNTQCPGTINIGKIIKYAKEDSMVDPTHVFKNVFITVMARWPTAAEINAYLKSSEKRPYTYVQKKFLGPKYVRRTEYNKLKTQVTKLQKDFATERKAFKDDSNKIISDLHSEYTKCRDRGVELVGEVKGLKEELKMMKEPKGPEIPRIVKGDSWIQRQWKKVLKFIAK